MSIRAYIVKVIRVVRVLITVVHQLNEGKIRKLSESLESVAIKRLDNDRNTSISRSLNSFKTVGGKTIVNFTNDVNIEGGIP